MWSFSSDVVRVWHGDRAILTLIWWGEIEANCRLPRIVVDWLPAGSTVEWEAECQIWLDQQQARIRIKWFGSNWCLFHWSGAEIWFVCQKTKKWNSGGIHRITWRILWVFRFFMRYYVEFLFYSCSIDVSILRYSQIFTCVRFGGRGAGNEMHYCLLTFSFSFDIHHSTKSKIRQNQFIISFPSIHFHLINQHFEFRIQQLKLGIENAECRMESLNRIIHHSTKSEIKRAKESIHQFISITSIMIRNSQFGRQNSEWTMQNAGWRVQM
jgi:hypothetical protein